MLGQPRVDRSGAIPEVVDGLPYADPHTIAGIEDDLPRVIVLGVLGSNNIGEFHLPEEERARPYGCCVEYDAIAVEVYAEQGADEEVRCDDHFSSEQHRETWLRRYQET